MNLRLSSRMIAPIVGVSLLLTVLGGCAAWYLHRLQQDASSLLVTSVAKVQCAEEMEMICHELRNHLNQFLITSDRSELSAASNLEERTHRLLAQAIEVSQTEQETALVAQIKAGYEGFFDTFRRVRREDESGDQRQAILELVRNQTVREILGPAHRYRDLNRRQMTQISQHNQRIADRMGLGLLLLGICGAVAGLLAGYGIARRIHQSIAQLSVPIRDATGKLNEVVGPITVSSGQSLGELEAALNDMSGRVETVVERLQQSQRAAQRSERFAALGQLSAGLTHELRNPLTSMRILVQSALEDGELARLEGRDLVVMDEEISRLDSSIQTFLDFARPPKLEKRPLILRNVLRQTVDFVSRRAAELGARIDCRLPERVLEIEADIGQIRQLLLNLLLNALEAMNEGGTVSVRMRYELADAAASGSGEACCETVPDWVILEVADVGRGLPAELGDRIFEPFISTKDSGAGLGLAICKRIVEEHGGEITAASRPEQGAVFTVRLPVGNAGSSYDADSKAMPENNRGSSFVLPWEASHADAPDRRRRT